MLIRLTYASRSTGALGPSDVKDIVRTSQRNNARLGVTGALLMADGVFLQCLEGDQAAVNALYHRIVMDPRHREPAILNFTEIDVRLHGAWSMGLVPGTAENRELLLRYSPSVTFDPFGMRPKALDALFAELVERARVLTA